MDTPRTTHAPESVSKAPSRPAASVGAGPTSGLGRTTAGNSNEAILAPRSQGFQLGLVASDRELLLQGRRAFAQGDDESALTHLRRLIRHGVEFADVHYMIGMVYERQDELDLAIESLREATRQNPSYVEALLALASVHERRGEFDQSETFAIRASQLARSTATGLDATTRGKLANQQAELANALAAAGELRDAIEQYRRALDRAPTFHDVRHRLGITLREAGLPSQAVLEFQKILEAHPGLLESQIQLGLTYYSMGRTPEAEAAWNAVLEQDPSRDEARMYLRLVASAGRARTARRDLDEARVLDNSGRTGWSVTELVSEGEE